jgi:WD40 repeat protein
MLDLDKVDSVRTIATETETLGPAGPHVANDDRGATAPSGPSRGGEDLPRRIGDYELKALIARGGMGVVYRASQLSLRRDVAVKLIRSSRFATEEEVRRFRVEAEAAARLDHPNAVPVYEVGEHEGEYFYSMKLIEGQSLAAGEFRHEPSRAARLLAKVARAIHAAHQIGILHRDIKPQNVLVDASGEPHVTDFGLAAEIGADSSTLSGVVVGTPQFMSPEQASGKRRLVTTAVDVYGLGALLYFLLTGQPPFRGESYADVLRQVVEQRPRAPRSLNPLLDRDLETICLKCLEKDPKDRYGSAEALAEDIERWLRIEPILARPISTTERILKWARRRPAVAASTAVAALAVLGGVVAVVVLWRQARTYAEIADHQRDNALSAQREAERQKENALTARNQAEHDRTVAVSRAEQLRLDAYALTMKRARECWDNSQRALLRQLLDHVSPKEDQVDLRGWEWWHLNSATSATGWELTFVTRAGPCRALGYLDGKVQVAIEDPEGVLSLWGPLQGGQNAPISLALGLTAVTLSDDGRTLAAAQLGGQLHVWDLVGGSRLIMSTARRANSQFDCLALDATGRRLADADGTTVRLWERDADDAPVLTAALPAAASALAFDPRGEALAIGTVDGSVSIWGPLGHDRGPTLRPLPDPQTREVTSLAFRPGGAEIASGSLDRTVHVRRVDTGAARPGFDRFEGPVLSLAYDPRGRTLAIGGDAHAVRVVDAETGVDRARLGGPAMGTVVGLAFHPDPARSELAACFLDGRSGTWALEAPRDALVHHGGPVRLVALGPRPSNRRGLGLVTVPEEDQKRAARPREAQAWRSTLSLDDQGTMRLEQAEALGTVAVRNDGHARYIAFSGDGSRLATHPTGREVLVHDAKTWEVAGRCTLSRDEPPRDEDVLCIALDTTGRRLAAGCEGGSVWVWDLDRGEADPVRLEHGDPVHALAFARDGTKLAAGGQRTDLGEVHAVRVWDLGKGLGAVGPALEYKARFRWAYSLAFSPDGRRLAAGTGFARLRTFRPSRVFVWDLDRREETLELEGHNGAVWALAFSPDGKRLASGSEDRTVRLWELRAGLEVMRLDGHDGPVVAVSFTPDGRWLAAADLGGGARAYDAGPEAR